MCSVDRGRSKRGRSGMSGDKRSTLHKRPPILSSFSNTHTSAFVVVATRQALYKPAQPAPTTATLAENSAPREYSFLFNLLELVRRDVLGMAKAFNHNRKQGPCATTYRGAAKNCLRKYHYPEQCEVFGGSYAGFRVGTFPFFGRRWSSHCLRRLVAASRPTYKAVLRASLTMGTGGGVAW